MGLRDLYMWSNSHLETVTPFTCHCFLTGSPGLSASCSSLVLVGEGSVPRPPAGLLEEAPAVAGPEHGGRPPHCALQVRTSSEPSPREGTDPHVSEAGALGSSGEETRWKAKAVTQRESEVERGGDREVEAARGEKDGRRQADQKGEAAKVFLSCCFFLFLATPTACECSQARDGTLTTAATRATAEMMPAPEPAEPPGDSMPKVFRNI